MMTPILPDDVQKTVSGVKVWLPVESGFTLPKEKGISDDVLS
jgi:hypothetical protein